MANHSRDPTQRAPLGRRAAGDQRPRVAARLLHYYLYSWQADKLLRLVQIAIGAAPALQRGRDALSIGGLLQSPSGPVWRRLLFPSTHSGRWTSSTALPTDLAATLNAALRADFELTFASSPDEPVLARGPVEHFEQAPARVPEPSTFYYLRLASPVPLSGTGGSGMRRRAGGSPGCSPRPTRGAPRRGGPPFPSGRMI